MSLTEESHPKCTFLRLPEELLQEILMACAPEDAFRMEKVLNRNMIRSLFIPVSHDTRAHTLDLQDFAPLIRLKTSMDDPPFKTGL